MSDNENMQNVQPQNENFAEDYEYEYIEVPAEDTELSEMDVVNRPHAWNNEEEEPLASASEIKAVLQNSQQEEMRKEAPFPSFLQEPFENDDAASDNSVNVQSVSESGSELEQEIHFQNEDVLEGNYSFDEQRPYSAEDISSIEQAQIIPEDTVLLGRSQDGLNAQSYLDPQGENKTSQVADTTFPSFNDKSWLQGGDDISLDDLLKTDAPQENISSQETSIDEMFEEVTPAAPEEEVFEEVTPAAPAQEVFEEVMPTAPAEEVFEEVTPAAPAEEVFEEVTPAAPEEEVFEEVAPAAPAQEVFEEVTPTAPAEEVFEEVAPAAPAEEVFEEVTPAAPAQEVFAEVTPTAPAEEVFEEVTPTAPAEEVFEEVTPAAPAEEVFEEVTPSAPAEEVFEEVTPTAPAEEVFEEVTPTAPAEEVFEEVTPVAPAEENSFGQDNFVLSAQEKEDVYNLAAPKFQISSYTPEELNQISTNAKLFSKNGGVQSFKSDVVKDVVLTDVSFAEKELAAWNIIVFTQGLFPLEKKVASIEAVPSNVGRYVTLVQNGSKKADLFNEENLKIINASQACVAVKGDFICGDFKNNTGVIINDYTAISLIDFAGKKVSFEKPVSGILTGPSGSILYFFGVENFWIPNSEIEEIDAQKMQYKISKWYSGTHNDKYFEFNARSESSEFVGNDEIKAIHVNMNNSSYGWNVAFDNGVSMNLRDLREFQTRFGKMPFPDGVISYGEKTLKFRNVERIVIYEAVQYFFYS